MTTEKDYLELAEDCKNRIKEKNKELKRMSKMNKSMIIALADIKLVSNNLLTIFEMMDEMTKPCRSGEVNIAMKRINNCLQDIDMAYQILNECDWESEEMDVLTRLTIHQLSN
tara:strand:+ start:181 stop:519 length:339 start_codon:yes stop_codon:yes gene_type:complete